MLYECIIRFFKPWIAQIISGLFVSPTVTKLSKHIEDPIKICWIMELTPCPDVMNKWTQTAVLSPPETR